MLSLIASSPGGSCLQAVFDIVPGTGLVLKEVSQNSSVEEVKKYTGAKFVIDENLGTF